MGLWALQLGQIIEDIWNPQPVSEFDRVLNPVNECVGMPLSFQGSERDQSHRWLTLNLLEDYYRLEEMNPREREI